MRVHYATVDAAHGFASYKIQGIERIEFADNKVMVHLTMFPFVTLLAEYRANEWWVVDMNGEQVKVKVWKLTEGA